MQVMVDWSNKLRKKIAERPSQEPISKIRSGSLRTGQNTRRHSVKLPDNQSDVNARTGNQAGERKRAQRRTTLSGRRNTAYGPASPSVTWTATLLMSPHLPPDLERSVAGGIMNMSRRKG